MTAQRICLGRWSFIALPGWTDVTESLDDENAPLTFAREDGVGALQFSICFYHAGTVPDPTVDDLRTMTFELGEREQLGPPIDVVTFSGEIKGAGASYHSLEDFVRVWHLSDGRNFMRISYVCSWDRQIDELANCEEMVRSIRFDS